MAILGQPAVWVGTDSGAFVSHDVGENWTWVTTVEGLNANSISALLLYDDTVWLGMAHEQDFGGDLFPVGDGFNYSTDGGNLWDTTLPPQSTGIGYFPDQIFGMLPFDLAGESKDTFVFHAGTRLLENLTLSSGGRVLGVTALGDTIADAQRRAYEAVAKIQFENACYRRDIAYRAVRSESPA